MNKFATLSICVIGLAIASTSYAYKPIPCNEASQSGLGLLACTDYDGRSLSIANKGNMNAQQLLERLPLREYKTIINNKMPTDVAIQKEAPERLLKVKLVRTDTAKDDSYYTPELKTIDEKGTIYVGIVKRFKLNNQIDKQAPIRLIKEEGFKKLYNKKK